MLQVERELERELVLELRFDVWRVVAELCGGFSFEFLCILTRLQGDSSQLAARSSACGQRPVAVVVATAVVTGAGCFASS